jgi:beta-glucosidase-like glycosyl hydrolase
MSAQHPKNPEEATAIETEGLKTQLSQSVEAQALKVRQLKSNKADKEEIDREVQNLLSLKKELALLEQSSGDQKKPAENKKPAKPSKTTFTLKTAKVRFQQPYNRNRVNLKVY